MKILIPALFSGVLANFGVLEKIHNRFLARQELQQLQQDSQDSQLPLGVPKSVISGVFQQKLDHYSMLDARVFNQRYHVNDDFYQAGGPVFLYIGGEAQLGPRSVSGGSIVDLAKMNNGLILGLEHRYYGESLPFVDMTAKNLTYLSSGQALIDLANFIQESVNLFPQYALSKAKWVVVGGSYPGNLAAWFRLKFPHLAVGAWASSAPVLAKADYWEYDVVVSSQLPSKCVDNIRNVTRFLEHQLSTGSAREINDLKNLFHPKMSVEVTGNVAFMYVLADIVSYVVQYDNPGSGLANQLCRDRSQEFLLSFAEFARFFFESTNTSPGEMDITSLTSLTVTDPSQNMIQWMWQCCSEFGYWQSAPHNSSLNARSSLRSKWITAEWHEKNICVNLFGFPKGYHVPVDSTNSLYGAQLVATAIDRIVFTNGGKDPWKVLGIQGIQLQLTAGAHSECPSWLIPGVGHCADLHANRVEDPLELRIARGLVRQEISSWLKQ